MTPEQKQKELERYRSLLMATLDYLEEHRGGSLVFDQYDPVTEHYHKQKILTEKYFRQGRLDRLQTRLASHIKDLQRGTDLNFTAYIKEKTGYEMDIFGDLRKRIDIILARNEIRGQGELNDLTTMLNFYQISSPTGREVEELRSFLAEHYKDTIKTRRKKKGEYSESISRVEKDSMVEESVIVSTGPKPHHYKDHWITSPGGNHKLQVAQWKDGKQASTYVAIHTTTGGSGAFYAVSGICPDVNAWWKDRSTIVVETKKEYKANTQCRQLRTFSEVINIEYVEH